MRSRAYRFRRLPLALCVSSKLLKRGEPVCPLTWNFLAQHSPFFSPVSLRRLHAIDGVYQGWQIEVVDRPSESFRAHEVGAGRYFRWFKRVSILNLGNYDFPHVWFLFGLISSGVPARNCARSPSAGPFPMLFRAAGEPSLAEPHGERCQVECLIHLGS